jgi:transcriptional regulator with XRE-family HTH domain
MSSKKTTLKKIGTVVKQHRKQLGLTQLEFGERVGIHRTYVGAIERGERNLTILKICDLAQALGTDIKELVSKLD